MGKWTTIIFFDKKKFNLDGFDEIQCYWHDLRKEEQVFSKRPFGGGSVVIRGAFSANGKGELAVIEGRQNAQKYVEVLETKLGASIFLALASASLRPFFGGIASLRNISDLNPFVHFSCKTL